jgi:hypothetical protein
MKTLLRHLGTDEYFQAPGAWTTDLQRAYDFHFRDRALQYARTWELQEVELAFVFEDSQSVTAVPVDCTSLRCAAA